MSDAILVINAGSSSLKFAIYKLYGGVLSAEFTGEVEGIGHMPHLTITNRAGVKLQDNVISGGDDEVAIAAVDKWATSQIGRGFSAVGHRVVHGGLTYTEPVLIDQKVLAELEALVPLAPLHQPHHIAAIRAIMAATPDVPQVACFDTAFHRNQPVLAQHFGLPRALTEKGIIRYGFHGLSYEYIVSALPRVAPEIANGKIVVAHLGNGASLCAIDKGRSIATTMSFTPVDGLVMGTRTGALDPGVVLYLLQHEGMKAEAIEKMLNSESGLLGVSGISSDMRELLASGAPKAREAVDLFVYRIGLEIGSVAAALGGLDAIVFTGGIGEHAAPIRSRVCESAAWLGVKPDDAANKAGGPRISAEGSKVSAWVVPTDENVIVARHTRDLLDRSRQRS
jgi:acetate kinase